METTHKQVGTDEGRAVLQTTHPHGVLLHQAALAVAVNADCCLVARYGFGSNDLGFHSSVHKYDTNAGVLAPPGAAYLLQHADWRRIAGATLLATATLFRATLGAVMGIVAGTATFLFTGGYSLLATQVLSRIHDRFGVELSTQAVFDAPTIAELAVMVEIRQIEGAEPQEVLAVMRESDSLMDEQVETLLSREGSEP